MMCFTICRIKDFKVTSVTFLISFTYTGCHIYSICHKLMGDDYLVTDRNAFSYIVIKFHGVNYPEAHNLLPPDGNHHICPILFPFTDIILRDGPFYLPFCHCDSSNTRSIGSEV